MHELLGEEASVDVAAASGQTALHCAAKSGSIAIIDWLVAAGTDLAARDSRGFTACYLAVKHNNVQAACRLVELEQQLFAAAQPGELTMVFLLMLGTPAVLPPAVCVHVDAWNPTLP